MTHRLRYRWCLPIALVCPFLALLGQTAIGQTQPTAPAPASQGLPQPRPVQIKPEIEPIPAEQEGCVPGGAEGAPISLPAALRLAQTSNLDIAQAREVVIQARARLQKANVSLLPNFN